MSMGWSSSSLGIICVSAANAAKQLYPSARVKVPTLLLSRGTVCLYLSFHVSWMWSCLVMQEWLCWHHSCLDMVFCIQCCGESSQTSIKGGGGLWRLYSGIPEIIFGIPTWFPGTENGRKKYFSLEVLLWKHSRLIFLYYYWIYLVIMENKEFLSFQKVFA